MASVISPSPAFSTARSTHPTDSQDPRGRRPNTMRAEGPSDRPAKGAALVIRPPRDNPFFPSQPPFGPTGQPFQCHAAGVCRVGRSSERMSNGLSAKQAYTEAADVQSYITERAPPESAVDGHGSSEPVSSTPLLKSDGKCQRRSRIQDASDNTLWIASAAAC